MRVKMIEELINSSDRRRFTERFIQRLSLDVIRILFPVLPQDSYMNLLVRTLRRYGMNIHGMPIYIDPTVWFDSTNYRLITVCEGVVISRNVNILTHDYSISRVRDYMENKRIWPEIALVRNVIIGNNSFIGIGAIIMPGAEIGANCIIGGGSIVRGKIPAESIVVGNPARVIGSSVEWGARKLSALDLAI